MNTRTEFIFKKDASTHQDVTLPVKPFIRWAGGKQNLVKSISKNVPDKFQLYFEPFLGAGSLFLYNNFENSTLSDINPSLINAYKQIQLDHVQVFHFLSRHILEFSSEYYYKLRLEFNQGIHENSPNMAAIFIFLVHTSFNGIYRVNKKGEYNVPFGKSNPAFPSLEHLNQISKKLKNVTIENCMYQDVTNRIGSNDFVYFDPPYPPLNQTSFFVTI